MKYRGGLTRPLILFMRLTMKRLYIFLLLLLIPTILVAQYRYDGRRIWPATIDSTKFTSDRSAAIGPGVIGGNQMYNATFGELWIPVQWDSGATAVAPSVPGGPWAFGADNYPLCVLIGTEPAYKVFGFDADGLEPVDEPLLVISSLVLITVGHVSSL